MIFNKAVQNFAAHARFALDI